MVLSAGQIVPQQQIEHLCRPGGILGHDLDQPTGRRELERFFGKTIFLETYVKVDKDWRSSDKELRNFGYQLD